MESLTGMYDDDFKAQSRWDSTYEEWLNVTSYNTMHHAQVCQTLYCMQILQMCTMRTKLFKTLNGLGWACHHIHPNPNTSIYSG